MMIDIRHKKLFYKFLVKSEKSSFYLLGGLFMSEPIIVPFKERVRSLIISAAKAYSTLLGTDYIIQSEQFVYRKEYIIHFKQDNFLHLTGVKTKLHAKHFFTKALKEKITESDYDCDSYDSLRRSVEKKLRVLVEIGNFFDGRLLFQEKYERNSIKCIIASANQKCTIGFTGADKLRPMTILNHNRLNPNNTVSEYRIFKNAFKKGGGSSQDDEKDLKY